MYPVRHYQIKQTLFRHLLSSKFMISTSGVCKKVLLAIDFHNNWKPYCLKNRLVQHNMGRMTYTRICLSTRSDTCWIKFFNVFLTNFKIVAAIAFTKDMINLNILKLYVLDLSKDSMNSFQIYDVSTLLDRLPSCNNLKNNFAAK